MLRNFPSAWGWIHSDYVFIFENWVNLSFNVQSRVSMSLAGGGCAAGTTITTLSRQQSRTSSRCTSPTSPCVTDIASAAHTSESQQLHCPQYITVKSDRFRIFLFIFLLEWTPAELHSPALKTRTPGQRGVKNGPVNVYFNEGVNNSWRV